MSIDPVKLTAEAAALRKRAGDTKTHYSMIGEEREISSHRYLWRNRFYAQALLTDALVALFEDGASGPIVSKWRGSSPKQALITRYIIRDCYKKRGTTTVNIIYNALKREISKGSVKTCFKSGTDLGLLQRVTGGYIPTELLITELQFRFVEKTLHPDVQAYCRFAVMWADQRQMALDAMDTADDLNFDGQVTSTLVEKIIAGDLDITER